MNHLFRFTSYGFLCTLFFSCGITTKVTDTDTNKMDFYESGVFTRPLVADIIVQDDRVQIEYSVPDYMKVKKDGKQNALIAFKNNHNCDFVIDPVYEIITKTGTASEVKIVLSGYPAKYENIQQVDTLPESVLQYATIPKDSREISFLNSETENPTTMGIDLIPAMSYAGFQFDKALNNDMMGYVSFEIPLTNSLESEFDFIDKSNDQVIGTYSPPSSSDYTTISVGLMKEYKMTRILKLRGMGGLNFTSQEFTIYPYSIDYTSNYEPASYQSDDSQLLSLGIRAALCLDIKIYRSIYFTAKAHSNVNLLNIISKPTLAFETYDSSTGSGTGWSEVQEYKLKDKSVTYDQFLNLGFGLRFEF